LDPISRQHLRANLLMLVASMIWGSTFVAQRISLDIIGPFLYTGLRFLLGAVVVLAFLFIQRRVQAGRGADVAQITLFKFKLIRPGILLGLLLAIAISFQQIGLLYTKVANSGFISSLYVVIVPLMGVVVRHRTGVGVWIGAVLAAIGLYFLSIDERFIVMSGDWYQLGCAIVISLHVMFVGYYAPRHDPLQLSIMQFIVCGVVCLLVGIAIEPVDAQSIMRAMPTIFYGGGLSVGIAYTIQVIAQRFAAPAHAAVIFSMEGVFAALTGWVVLQETLTLRALFGCALMLAGLLFCQLLPSRHRQLVGVSST
jgi:drug/metabolite transporter (DMT)-like permease